MSTIDATLLQRRWTASEIRKLPPDLQDAILRQAAAKAETEYQSNTELTDFDAFGAGSVQSRTRRTESPWLDHSNVKTGAGPALQGIASRAAQYRRPQKADCLEFLRVLRVLA